MTPLEQITERICRLGHPDDPSTPRPLVSIDEFFVGNTEVGSIGCNLPGEPVPEQFHRLFSSFAERQDVKDIRVQITMFDVPEWPFSDTVYIMTSASAEEVMGWFPEELKPDETWLGFAEGQDFEPYIVAPGVNVVACWWD